MTNEELARAIQGGDKDKLLELWAAVRRFAHDRAYRWTMAVGGRAGLSVDDFEQVAFLALLEALEGWEDRGGSFLTWYGLKLRGAFSEASGQRTKRDQLDPIQSAVSLETPPCGQGGRSPVPGGRDTGPQSGGSPGEHRRVGSTSQGCGRPARASEDGDPAAVLAGAEGGPQDTRRCSAGSATSQGIQRLESISYIVFRHKRR